MSRKQERKTEPAADKEEETAPDPEQPSSTSAAAETSAKASKAVDAIDDVLEDFDALTRAELGFKKDEVVDPAVIDEAIRKKVAGFEQKGGQ